jgi:hypothetical protein
VDLTACPGCGAMAPTHAHECAFCGTALPREVTPPPVLPESAIDAFTAAPAAAPSGPAWVAPDPTTNPPDPLGTSSDGGSRRLRRWVIAGFVVVVAALGIAGLAVSRSADGLSDRERQALAGEGTWQTFDDPDGAFRIDLPTEPIASSVEHIEQVTARAYAAGVDDAVFAVQIYDIAGGGGTAGIAGEELLNRMPDLFTGLTGGTHNVPMRTTAGGLPAIQFDIDAGEQKWSATAVLTGNRVFILAAAGPDIAVGGHARMVESFVPTDPA